MKKLLILGLAISMIFSLAACGRGDTDGANSTKNSTLPAEIPNSMETSAVGETEGTFATNETQETASQSTEPSDTAVLVEIWRSDFPIYDGPSYDNYLVGTVEVASTYTIVEQLQDSEGNLWGRLKSGLGWVDLSLLEREIRNRPPVTVAKASEAILNSGNYHYCQADFSSYAYQISISAHQTLRNVSFFSINGYGNYKKGETLFSISRMDSSKPLVASVCFPGHGSLYGLEFTDHNGVTRVYTIGESGRNGSVGISLFSGTLTPADPELEPWKTAYLRYIESLGDEKTYCQYSLAYVDSDDIPELFISGGCEASGSRVCSYKAGKVVDTYLRRLGGVLYIPQSGLVYNFNGNMGYYSAEIYRLSNVGFTSLFYGLQEDSYEEILNELGEYEYVTLSKYYITEEDTSTQVTEEAFYAAQSEIFDFSISEGFGYGAYDYTTILKQIKDW